MKGVLKKDRSNLLSFVVLILRYLVVCGSLVEHVIRYFGGLGLLFP